MKRSVFVVPALIFLFVFQAIFSAASAANPSHAGIQHLAASGTITASPNPVFIPSGQSTGTTTISWTTSGTTTGQIWVSVNGASETLFASGTSGSSPATWIEPKKVFRFNLYAAASSDPGDKGAYIGTATVGGISGTGCSIGMNRFDHYLDYIGGGPYASPELIKVYKAMAKKSVVDCKNLGIQYIRVSVTGYGPNDWGQAGDIDKWQSNPTEFWAVMDELFADLNANGVKIVPVFIWNFVSFPAMAGDTVRDMIVNPSSASCILLKQYITDFVTRYKDNDAILFWELTNELNLCADLDNSARNPWGFRTYDNYTTDQMISFAKNISNHIRSIDQTHLISSGYALPRTCAEHLRAKPEFLPGGPDWTSDTQAEFEKNLADIHTGIDIVTVHFYNGGGDNERFGNTGMNNAGLLDIVKAKTDSIGKVLWVGEFGDDPTHHDPYSKFTHNVVNKTVQLDIPFSAPWIMEFYQFNTYTPNEMNIEPGYTDYMLGFIKQANVDLGNPPVPVQNPDITKPTVVLNWPLEGATLPSGYSMIYSVASDNDRVAKVEFLVDGYPVSTNTTVPYRFALYTDPFPAGLHMVSARAYDPANNWAEWVTNMTFGSAPPNTAPLAPSTPTGSSAGIQNIPNQYSAVSTDPDNDQLRYGWDWNGDGNVDEWSDWTNSGVEDVRSHAWSSPGTYDVKVKVVDQHGAESGWSGSLQVTIQATVPEYNASAVIVAVLFIVFIAVRWRKKEKE